MKGAILQKSNKLNYQHSKAYRIITLLNYLRKIAEKLVAKRLTDLCEHYQLLHKDQIRGQQHWSVTDAIMSLTYDIQLAAQKKKTISALFMNVKETFDNVFRHTPTNNTGNEDTLTTYQLD